MTTAHAANSTGAAIVGGGLAGLSAAITLAQRGVPVTLFEAKTYPNHKVCGEFLSPESRQTFADLGISAQVAAMQPASITHAAVTAPDGTTWEAPLPGSGIGLSRYALDLLLYGRALSCGVDVRTGTTVTRVEGSLRDGFTLHTRDGAVRAQVVIAAHGKRSTLDRTLNRPFMWTPQPYIGIKTHFYGDAPSNRVELHSFPGGYCGISAIEGGRTNVCLLARTEVFREQGGGRIPAFITWMQAQNPHLRAWMAGARQAEDWISISQVSFAFKAPVVDDLLMVGDAAGLVAPLAGDGMAMALHSGQMAGEHAYRYLCEDHPALVRDYAAEWRRTFMPRLRLARAVQPVLFQPRLIGAGLRVLRRMPSVGGFLVRHTRTVSLQ